MNNTVNAEEWSDMALLSGAFDRALTGKEWPFSSRGAPSRKQHAPKCKWLSTGSRASDHFRRQRSLTGLLQANSLATFGCRRAWLDCPEASR